MERSWHKRQTGQVQVLVCALEQVTPLWVCFLLILYFCFQDTNDMRSIKNKEWVLWAKADQIGISKDIPALNDPFKQKWSIKLIKLRRQNRVGESWHKGFLSSAISAWFVVASWNAIFTRILRSYLGSVGKNVLINGYKRRVWHHAWHPCFEDWEQVLLKVNS